MVAPCRAAGGVRPAVHRVRLPDVAAGEWPEGAAVRRGVGSMSDWVLPAWLLLGGSTLLLFLGGPVAFAFLVTNLVGAWLYRGQTAGLGQLVRNGFVAVSTFALTPIP